MASSAYIYYTIKEGDTLSSIATKHGTTVDALERLNPNISDPNRIYAGDVIKVGLRSDSGDKDESNPAQYAKITNFGLMYGTTREVFAQWTWSQSNTEHYELLWMYGNGSGIGYIGSRTTTAEKQATWTAPENATHVTLQVRPISKKYKPKNSDEEVSYWTAEWTSKVRYYFSENPPEKPTGLNVEIVNNYSIVASLDNLTINADTIEFQVVKDDTKVYDNGKAKIKLNHASWTCSIDPGHTYKVRCRASRTDGKDTVYSDWTEYSSTLKTVPPPPKQILELRGLSETDVYLDWNKVASADSYEIEYTTKQSNFDSSTNAPSKHTVNAPLSHAEIRDLESGKEWFFRVRAVNSAGSSYWTDIKSVTIGTKPIAPTTWSSTTTVEVGESVTLYWIHNSEDESKETSAIITLDIDGVRSEIYQKADPDEQEKSATSWLVLDTKQYKAGATIKWWVRTMGALGMYGDYSIERVINVYAPPVLSVDLSDNETLTHYPLNARIEAGPDNQTPISYHVSISALEAYETYDRIGNIVYVSENEEIYSKYIETDELEFDLALNANDIDLRNNIHYLVTVTVSMDTGLSKSKSAMFEVAWSNEIYHYPNAELSYEPDTYSMLINPYCKDTDDLLVEGVTLAVYRREFDGSFKEIASNLENNGYMFVTDPHPSLDFARYRVTATDTASGTVSVYDIPPVEIGEGAVIIQWNEEWTTFTINDEPTDEGPAWTGSLVRLPFNIDISESNSPDVVLINYIGREHPTSYYGTQIGQTLSCSGVIEATDKETLYTLRRLARWMGDVYIREPSGNGYWANIKVNISQKHRDLTIPVSIDITRVEGGI